MNKKLLVIYLCAFIGPLGGNAVLALIPTLKGAFGVHEAEVLLAITLFMLPFAVGQLFSGAIARVYNYQNTMVAGYIIYAMGSIVTAGSQNITIFLASRVIQGIGFALVSPVTVAIIGDLTEPRTRGRHMGLLNAAIGGGIFLGPIMAGGFALFDWRYTFYALALLAICIAYLFWFTFKDMAFQRSTASIKALGTEYKSVIKNPRVIMLCTAGFLTFFSLIGVISFTVDFASKPPLSLLEYQLGIILASSGLAQIILALPGGVIVDWIGRARTAFIGFSFAAVIAFMFIFADSHIHFVVLAGMIGFASVLIWAVLVTLSVEIMQDKKIYVTSLFNSLRFFGYAAGPVLLVGIYTGINITAVYLICAFTFAVNILLLKSITATKSCNHD